MFSVIMAGGTGTRFWPQSRRKKPKQLLNIFGQECMLRQTIKRLEPISTPDQILIVINKEIEDEVINEVPEIPRNNIIVEPDGRNTAPCIGLAALFIKQIDPEAIMGVFPADHLINKPGIFIDAVKRGEQLLHNYPEYLITLGIAPSYPATGYGYIYVGDKVSNSDFFSVKHFVEKPTKEMAAQYIASGDYLWNSGMFMWKTAQILKLIHLYLPELSEGLHSIEKHLNKDTFAESIQEVYSSLKSVSIDVGIMEKVQQIVVSKVDPGWNDVGTWKALDEVLKKDDQKNIWLTDKNISINASNILAYAPHKLVAAIGIEDMIIVDTKDALLICHKKEAQKVKEIVERLKQQGDGKYL